MEIIEINSKVAGAFVNALGWYNAHLRYCEDIDKFIGESATTDPEEEYKFNQLYRMFKEGIKYESSKDMLS